MQVALATFDSAVQFYSFRSGSSQPGMLIVTDIAEPFVPDSVPLVRVLVVWEGGEEEGQGGGFSREGTCDSCCGSGGKRTIICQVVCSLAC